MQSQFPKKGGFRKISGPPKLKRCHHPEHNPPGYISLKPGFYEYTCPGCGQVTPYNVPEIRI